MSILNTKIRSWWIEKDTDSNMPTNVVFEAFKPTIMSSYGKEWIRVISLDDFHREAGMTITRWAEVCKQLDEANKRIAEAEEVIKFYATGAKDDLEPKPDKLHLYDEDYPMSHIKWRARSMSDFVGGKRARAYLNKYSDKRGE